MRKEQNNGMGKIIILVVILIVAVIAEYFVLKKDELFGNKGENNSNNQVSNEVNVQPSNNVEPVNPENANEVANTQNNAQENVPPTSFGDNYTVIFVDGKQYEIHSTSTPSFLDWFNEYGVNEGYTIVNNEIYKTDRNVKINMHGKKYNESGLKSFESYDLVSADSTVNNIN